MPELIIGFIIFVILLVILPGCRVIRQYERGVVFTLGKYTGQKQPGLRVIIPYLQTISRVDVRSTPIDVPKQEVITKDNVTVGVDAIVYFRVLDPAKALLETTNYVYATTNFAQAALRDITGNFELDELLSKRDEISAQIKEIVDKETDKWGIDIENVKLQNIELPGDMKRAMARQKQNANAAQQSSPQKVKNPPLNPLPKPHRFLLRLQAVSRFVPFRRSRRFLPTQARRLSLCFQTILRISLRLKTKENHRVPAVVF